MSSTFSKLFRKWPCCGGNAPSSEGEAENRMEMNNHPEIIITNCESGATSPTFSRQSSSASSKSSPSEDEVEEEIFLKTDGNLHKMGMEIAIRTRTLDETAGGENTNSVSLTRVTNVELGSFAHGFGVRKGDIISKINGQKCSGDIVDIREAFTTYNSDELEMEILRNVRNRETGNPELLKVTICNARSVGNCTEEIEEVIRLSRSWSLSDVGAYIQQGQRYAFLQFECEGTPWVVKERNKLVLARNLSEDQVMTDGMFCIYDYWTQGMDSGIPVVIQHVASGLCVSLVGNSIELVEERELDLVTNHSLIFIQRAPPESGPQVTFQSAGNSSYIGFQTQGRRAYGSAGPYRYEYRNIVFLKTDM